MCWSCRIYDIAVVKALIALLPTECGSLYISVGRICGCGTFASQLWSHKKANNTVPWFHVAKSRVTWMAHEGKPLHVSRTTTPGATSRWFALGLLPHLSPVTPFFIGA
ncbi:unnamed protein product [Ectocarpus sp. 8 AP-2014]